MSAFIPSGAAITAARSSNVLYSPKYRPVGVFLGGTSGIGQAMAEQLAKQTNGRAKIILLGRNKEAAAKIIAGFPKTPESTPAEEASDYSFIKVDATSMAEIREVAARISREVDKINFIVTSAGNVDGKGREETSEGLDVKMACIFYARFRLIHDLLPLVQKAAERGERTGVVSIFAAGRGGPIDDLDNLGLVKDYTFLNARRHMIGYTDVTFEKLAQLYPKVPLYHEFPALVTTPAVTNMFTGARFVLPLFSWGTVTPEESAQVMWWRVWTSESDWETGAYQIGNRGNKLPPNDYVSAEGKKQIWEHALKMTA